MQIKKTWDRVTILKTLKGLAISATAGAALAALAFIGNIDFGGNALLAAMVAVLVPAATNAVREWMKGE